MNKWVLGSFYTLDSPYESVINQYLLPSLRKLTHGQREIRYVIKPAKNYHNWTDNVAQKPLIISEILNEIDKDECLVMVDADATVMKYPELFDTIPEPVDVAAHLLSWRQWYGHETEHYELLSGTMFFRNNQKVLNLCQDWYEQAVQTQEWEQTVLQRILVNHPINFYELPLSYCFIKSRPGGLPPLVNEERIILHHQVSRELRKGIL